jgi:hypothetical protein
MGFFNGKGEPEQGFTVEDLKADAARMIALLQALITEFVDENDNEPLTKKEICTASRTPLVYLEESAALCEAEPELPTPPRAAKKLRLTRAANDIYGEVLETTERLTRLIRMAMWRKNLAGVMLARTVNRRADLLVETGGGQRLRTHLDRLKRIPGRPWRRKAERR